MGRQLRRVPLDFSWPLDKAWEGFLNPHWKQRKKCPACDGTGYAPEAKLFSEQWYGMAPFDPVAYGATPLTVDHPAVQAFAKRNVECSPEYYGRGDAAVRREARRLFDHWRDSWCHRLVQADVDALVAAERLWDFTREPRNEEQAAVVRAKVAAGGNSWLPESNGYTPTADEVNAWSMSGTGHDAINRGVCVEARCKREGVPCLCPHCEGSGDWWPSVEAKAACDAWTETKPPVGEGWQLWETVSEGSPISPVFPTVEAFVTYLVGEGYSKKAAEAFVKSGWAPSAVTVHGEVKANIHALDDTGAST